MRTRIIYDRGRKVAEYRDGECVFRDEEYFGTQERSAAVMDDLPAYTSPIDGRLVDGRAQRREDLKRNGARPWEGLEQERKEAQRREQYAEQQQDRQLERAAGEVYGQFRVTYKI